MNNTEILKKLSFEVNDLLSEYIQLHDKILKKGGIFISLFKKVDFEKILNDCHEILRKFEIKRKGMLSFKKENGDNLDDNEKKYLNQLISFFDKLLVTINFLLNKQQLLYKKSQKEKIGWEEYNNAENQYKKSIDDYLMEGRKLNNLNSLVFQ
ncbi:MAG: hypothetical protein U9Q24_04175 [Candidatus Ratteibacteria bacterium]|nr:hypothetical protein [Candidatus Ratteibacteria bacterium]